MIWRISGFFLALMVSVLRVQAATEYLYGIGTDWNLYQLSVNKGASTVVSTKFGNLSGYVSGFGTHQNEYINGLAIDPATGNIFFNYSYNANTSASTGPLTVVPYVYQNKNGAYIAPYALGAAITSSTLPLTTVSSGYLPRSAYYNGAYWLGVQNSDTLVQLPITGTTSLSYTGVNQFSNFDHSATTTLGGGDFVIGSNDVIYGSTVLSSANTFFRQQISNATNVASGASWTNFNIDSSIPFATQGSIQVAGLGQSASSDLYVVSSTGRNVYLVNGNDDSTAPTFTQIGSSGVVPITMTDLSIIVTAPLPVPETSTKMGGGLLVVAGTVEGWRRFRRPKGRIRPCPGMTVVPEPTRSSVSTGRA